MDRVNGEERPLLIPIHGVPTIPRDDRAPFKKQLAVYLILGSTVFERIAFYSIAATLPVAADPEGCSAKSGPVVSLIFTGTSNFCTLIFAVFSDWRLGRGKTILMGYIFYLIGYVSLTIFAGAGISDCSKTDPAALFTGHCASFIYPALILTAIGASAVQCSISVLGGEQFQDVRDVSRYFDKYVVAVNIGAILAKISFYFASSHNDILYYYAFIYGVSALTVSCLLFLTGYRHYLHIKSTETIVTKLIPVILNALQNWYQHRRNNRRDATVEDSAEIEPEEEATLLDFAKAENGGKFLGRTVNEVKSLRDALVVFALLIPYWLIYDQLNSTFRLQARHMTGGDDDWSMIGVSLVDPVVLISGILIINIFIYRAIAAQQRLLSIPMKFIVGMCIAIVTMLIAGSIEAVRQDEWTNTTDYSNLTIYAAIPQIFSMGASELFMMVASFEYAFLASPRSAQTFFMSLRFCSIGISSFLGAAYISLYTAGSKVLDFSVKCPEGSKYEWQFFTYFFVLGGIQFIFLLIFILCQRKYQLIQLNRQQIHAQRAFRH